MFVRGCNLKDILDYYAMSLKKFELRGIVHSKMIARWFGGNWGRHQAEDDRIVLIPIIDKYV